MGDWVGKVKDRLVVTEWSQGCEVQHGEYMVPGEYSHGTTVHLGWCKMVLNTNCN